MLAVSAMFLRHSCNWSIYEAEVGRKQPPFARPRADPDHDEATQPALKRADRQNIDRMLDDLDVSTPLAHIHGRDAVVAWCLETELLRACQVRQATAFP